MLFEADDPMLVTQFNMAWNDILEADLMVVLDTEKDLMSVLYIHGNWSCTVSG